MRILIQRVENASVKVNSEVKGEIGRGYLVLIGVTHGDGISESEKMAEKTVHLRIMSDEAGKMNKDILDTKGEILVISQFTLYADTKGQRRPSFIKALEPNKAKELITDYCRRLNELGVLKVAEGVFGAYMKVELINDGPVTIILDSSEI